MHQFLNFPSIKKFLDEEKKQLISNSKRSYSQVDNMKDLEKPNLLEENRLTTEEKMSINNTGIRGETNKRRSMSNY